MGARPNIRFPLTRVEMLICQAVLNPVLSMDPTLVIHYSRGSCLNAEIVIQKELVAFDLKIVTDLI